MLFERDEDLKKKLLPNGPWQDEPDYYEFLLPSGLLGVVARTEQHLCGYIGPIYKNKWLERVISEMRVHGGVTWGESHYVGFDCGHYMDFTHSKYEHERFGPTPGTYRTFEYVVDQIRSMDNQILDMFDKDDKMLTFETRKNCTARIARFEKAQDPIEAIRAEPHRRFPGR